MGYTDLTNTFEPNRLLIWQDFKALADNDAFKRIPSGTKMVFFQSTSPTGWTKQTGLNNRALRVVSGSGGVSGGGSHFLGTAVDLAHIHTTPNHDHTWTHNHVSLFTTSVPKTPVLTVEKVNSANSDGANLHAGPGANTGRTDFDGDYANTIITTVTAAPSLATTLGSITFKYYDAIICAKD